MTKWGLGKQIYNIQKAKQNTAADRKEFKNLNNKNIYR